MSDDAWIYRQLADERLVDDVPGRPGTDPATTMLPAYQLRYGTAIDWAWPDTEQPARTAGEEDHSNPWFYAGDDADPPGATS